MSFPPLGSAWRAMSVPAKIAISLFSLLLLLLVIVSVHNLSAPFGPDRAVYEHLAQIARLYDGNPLYSPLTFDFNVITYTPLYWWVCSLVWKCLGPGFLSPQIVSLLASLVFIGLVVRWVWQKTEKDLFLTAFAGFLLIMAGVFTGFWLFMIHVDALHFALTIAGFYALRRLEGRSLGWAALWLSLGALTKQTGLAYVAAGGLYVLLRTPRKALWYFLPAALVTGGVLMYLQVSSDGYFFEVVVRQNQGPPWELSRLLNEVWGLQFLGQTAILLLFTLWPLAGERGWKNLWQNFLTPEHTMAAAGILVASIAQPKFGSGNNHAVIAMAGLIICGLDGIRAAARRISDPAVAERLKVLAVLLPAAAFLIPAWREASLRHIDDHDRATYAQIVSVFKQGPTILYHFPYITRSFGYPEGGHQGNENCLWLNGCWTYENKPEYLNTPYREQRYDYIILGASTVDQDDPTIKAILENYTVVGTLPPHPTKPNTLMLRYPIYILQANRIAKPNEPDRQPR